MAVTNQGTTYGYGFAPGTGVNREDLVDMIHNIDPWDTPLFTTSPKTKAYHVYHEWPEDTLAATSTAGAIEGADFGAAALSTPDRHLNITQIFRKDVAVSLTQLEVNPAGISDMYRYQVGLGVREIKRNVEVRAFSAPGGSATGASGTARVMKSLADFMTTNSYGAGNTAIGGTGTAAGDSALPLTETEMNGILQQIYEDGGNPMDVYVSPPVKRVISQFITASDSRRYAVDQTSKLMVGSIMVYDSDFGMQYIHLDRWVPTGAGSATNDGTVFFIDRTRCRFAFLRNPRHTPVASIGDSVRGMVLTEITVELINEKGHGYIFGVSNTTAVTS